MHVRANVRTALAAFAVAGGGAVAAFLGPAGPAVGQSSPPIQAMIQVSSPATLVARGAGAEVTVTAVCSGPSVVSTVISVSLAERAASASGSSALINCTGSSQTIQLIVTPQVGRALRKGTAIAKASMNVFCSVPPAVLLCASQAAQVTIQVVS